MPDFDRAPWPDIGRFVSGTAVPIIIIVAFAWIFLALAERFIDGLVRRLIVREAAEGTARALSAAEVQRRIDTVTALLVSLLRVLVVTIAVIMVLGKFSVDVGPAVAGLGIVGIAVGFGAQSLVKDFFNGVLILVENQFVKGDVIRVAGVSGTVEDFTLRRTTLRDGDGVVHSVPNGEIAVSSNLTRVWAQINENISVAYGTNIDDATRVVDQVGTAMAADPEWQERVLEAPHVVRVEALGDYGVTLKVMGAVHAEERWAAPGEFRKRLLAAFHEHGIEIARPPQAVVAASGGGATQAAPASATQNPPTPTPAPASPTTPTTPTTATPPSDPPAAGRSPDEPGPSGG